jgi:4-hydroxy-4-methyl-2-oxoglutarate aldolase
MITDPPILTIRRDFPRPHADLIAAFAGVPTGHVVDAMNGRGALDYCIKPLAPGSQVTVGVALTCDNGPADNLAVFGALDAAKPGDIVVAATDSFTRTALIGDLLLGMLKNRGVLAFVTDGLVRDLPGLLAVGLPVYCAGLTPNSPVRNGPGTVGLPIVVGGIHVEPGDIVVADQDGVVIVPRGQARQVLEGLSGVRAAEAALEAKVKGGLEVPDFVETLLRSDRVVELP